VTLDTFVYLTLTLFALVLICIPMLLGYHSSSPASIAARGASFVGFLLLVGGSVLASSCLLGDCLGLAAAADGASAVLPYLWFFTPGALLSLVGWALALVATDRQRNSRRYLLILVTAPATLLAALGVGGAAFLLNSRAVDVAGMWIAGIAYLAPCLPLLILLAVPKGNARITSATTTA